MTDWYLMLERIQNAIEALDRAHAASEALRSNTSHQTLDEFRTEMLRLADELEVLKDVMNHDVSYGMDELVDLLSQMSSGHPAAYRRMPRDLMHKDKA